MSKPEERDLFDVFEEWGYEICPYDTRELSPQEQEEILALQEAVARLLGEDGVDCSPPCYCQADNSGAVVALPLEGPFAVNGDHVGQEK